MVLLVRRGRRAHARSTHGPAPDVTPQSLKAGVQFRYRPRHSGEGAHSDGRRPRCEARPVVGHRRGGRRDPSGHPSCGSLQARFIPRRRGVARGRIAPRRAGSLPRARLPNATTPSRWGRKASSSTRRPSGRRHSTASRRRTVPSTRPSSCSTWPAASATRASSTPPKSSSSASRASRCPRARAPTGNRRKRTPQRSSRRSKPNRPPRPAATFSAAGDARSADSRPSEADARPSAARGRSAARLDGSRRDHARGRRFRTDRRRRHPRDRPEFGERGEGALHGDRMPPRRRADGRSRRVARNGVERPLRRRRRRHARRHRADHPPPGGASRTGPTVAIAPARARSSRSGDSDASKRLDSKIRYQSLGVQSASDMGVENLT